MRVLTPKEARRERGPSGLSVRSFSRAVAAGWSPPPMDENKLRKAQMRHGWFRRSLRALANAEASR
jgi:hypothetical protein